MTGQLKDRFNLSLLLAIIFFAGVLASVYVIYSLPSELSLTDGYQNAFTNVFVVLTLTFIAGGLNIWYGARHKNEIIVYRDKQIDKTKEEAESERQSQSSISMEPVVAGIKLAKTPKEILHNALQAICKQLEAGQGAIYMNAKDGSVRKVDLQAGYALSIGESNTISFEYGEGLVGQVASGGSALYIDEVPEGYVKIVSGLGSASPKYLLIVPLKKDNQVLGVVEIATFTPINQDQRKFVEESAQVITGSLSGN
jgi:transcriptional regulator with GAF, ATPase, and Fis domain